MPTDPPTHNLAFFISAHGYGHAARACAVMDALRRRNPALHFHLFTAAPSWLFDDSLGSGFTLHPEPVDVGLVQLTPLHEDLPATLSELVDFIPFDPQRVEELAAMLRRMDCRAVVCDISPLGVAAAKQAGIPSILVENFTWDWIYAGYLEAAPGFLPFIQALHAVYAGVDLHLQTEPLCAPSPRAALTARPAGRLPRHDAAWVRSRLNLPARQPVILISMGGIKGKVAQLERLAATPGVVFVIPGGSERFERWGSLSLLPHHSDVYHPDLVHACDAVVSKAGYSTVAEAYHAGVPFGYVSRARFREAAVMAQFIEREMGGFEIPEASFADGSWVERAAQLAAVKPIAHSPVNGADELAEEILDFIK